MGRPLQAKNRKRTKEVKHGSSNKTRRLTKTNVALQTGNKRSSGNDNDTTEGESSDQSEERMDEDEAATPTAGSFGQVRRFDSSRWRSSKLEVLL